MEQENMRTKAINDADLILLSMFPCVFAVKYPSL